MPFFHRSFTHLIWMGVPHSCSAARAAATASNAADPGSPRDPRNARPPRGRPHLLRLRAGQAAGLPHHRRAVLPRRQHPEAALYPAGQRGGRRHQHHPVFRTVPGRHPIGLPDPAALSLQYRERFFPTAGGADNDARGRALFPLLFAARPAAYCCIAPRSAPFSEGAAPAMHGARPNCRSNRMPMPARNSGHHAR